MLLQNPFEFGAMPLAPDEAAVSPGLHASDTAADLSDSHDVPAQMQGSNDCGLARDDVKPGATMQESRPAHPATALSDIDCIGEIFVGARKLEQIPGIFDQAAITPADELLYVTLKAMDDPWAADLIEMPYGMEGLFDPPPLFLRQAG